MVAYSLESSILTLRMKKKGYSLYHGFYPISMSGYQIVTVNLCNHPIFKSYNHSIGSLISVSV